MIENPKTSFWKLLVVVLALLAIRAFATAKDNLSDFCYFDTVTKEIECMVFGKRSFTGVSALPAEKKRIHSQRLLIKAQKNLEKRVKYHSYIANLVMDYSDIEQEMSVMGEEYLRELRNLESKIITNGR